MKLITNDYLGDRMKQPLIVNINCHLDRFNTVTWWKINDSVEVFTLLLKEPFLTFIN